MKVFIIAALTADGFIGQTSDHLVDWTGSEDKKLFVKLTHEAGTIIMGARTFTTIGRALPGRRTIVYTTRSAEITADSVETTSETPAVLLERLAAEGCPAVAICGGSSIYNLFMNSGYVTELHLTYVPILFGSGLPLLKSARLSRLKLIETSALTDGSIYVHYQVA